MYGAKILHRYSGTFEVGKAAFDSSRSMLIRVYGSYRSENSGVSSRKKREDLFGRMRKVSCANDYQHRVSRT